MEVVLIVDSLRDCLEDFAGKSKRSEFAESESRDWMPNATAVQNRKLLGTVGYEADTVAARESTVNSKRFPGTGGQSHFGLGGSLA
jgi:hypothetical protein